LKEISANFLNVKREKSKEVVIDVIHSCLTFDVSRLHDSRLIARMYLVFIDKFK